MHKWLAITLFPRDDVRPVRNDELIILYAMVNKIKISPAQALVKQWLSNFKMMGPIECTSLITRIPTHVGALEGNFIPFIEGNRAYIDEAYLIQGHTHKKGLDDSWIFFFMGYTNEIPLPNAEFHLYNCCSLTIPLVPREGGRRHRSFGLPGRMTRSRARREAEPIPPPQQPQHSHQHEASGSSWHSASTEEWAWQAPSRRCTSSSSSGAPNLIRRIASSRGFGAITQQLGELRVQSDNNQDTLHQHIKTSQAWQCHTSERLHDMEQMQLQRQEEWRAYCCWTGFNPDQP
jgi:hypothetical protein